MSSFRFDGSIPVVPMADETATKDFYLDFLGYAVDWEHRFREGAPLYLQVRQGQSILHLDGHAREGPRCTVRVSVEGLGHFHELLCSRTSAPSTPALVRPRGTNLEMPVEDPSGNLLIFWDPDS